MEFEAKLENQSTNNEFIIAIRYYPVKESFDFKFGNASKGLERKDLVFKNEDGVVLAPYSMSYINARSIEKDSVKITKDSPYIYKVTGSIESKKDKVLIKMASVEYLLEKGKNYAVYLEYLGEKSNNLLLNFE